MKKIMFSDKYGLTKAVLDDRKTMTRRMIPIGLYNQTDWKAVSEGNYEAVSDGEGDWHDIRLCGRYQIGEEIAIAQSYRNIIAAITPSFGSPHAYDNLRDKPGWNNKMFVRADLMPHRIRITDIRMERVQNISEEDCMKEGVMEGEFMNTRDRFYFDEWGDVPNHITFRTPRGAYADLIDKVSGKGTWYRNLWVFVYEFKLVK